MCPPAVEYSREFQKSAAEEVASLPERSAIAEMLADYSVMRDQARLVQVKDGQVEGSRRCQRWLFSGQPAATREITPGDRSRTMDNMRHA